MYAYKNNCNLYQIVIGVVVVLIIENPDTIEAAGWGSVVEVVLAQVGSVINQPEMISYFFCYVERDLTYCVIEIYQDTSIGWLRIFVSLIETVKAGKY